MNAQALERFMDLSTENTKLLKKLTTYISNNMNTESTDINWGNVGDAGHVNEGLKDITEFLGIK